VAAITSTRRKVRAFKAGFPDEATYVVLWGEADRVAQPPPWRFQDSGQTKTLQPSAGRVSSVTKNAQTLVTGVTYLPFGMAARWTAGNGASYLRTFDLDGRITGLALPAGDNIGLNAARQ
jgi:hypothetical protein